MADVTKTKVDARLRLIRNGRTLYDQEFRTGREDYTRFAQHRAVLSTNMSSFEEISLQDINSTNPGEKLLLETTSPITVAINATGNAVEVKSMFAVVAESISHVYVKNTDASIQPTITVILTD